MDRHKDETIILLVTNVHEHECVQACMCTVVLLHMPSHLCLKQSVCDCFFYIFCEHLKQRSFALTWFDEISHVTERLLVPGVKSLQTLHQRRSIQSVTAVTQRGQVTNNLQALKIDCHCEKVRTLIFTEYFNDAATCHLHIAVQWEG